MQNGWRVSAGGLELAHLNMRSVTQPRMATQGPRQIHANMSLRCGNNYIHVLKPSSTDVRVSCAKTWAPCLGYESLLSLQVDTRRFTKLHDRAVAGFHTSLLTT